MSSLAPKNDFIGLEGCVHLAAGGETPQLRTIKEALERFVEDKSRGGDSRARFLDVSQEARERLGRMMKVPASDIAFLGSCSDAINQVCWSLPWQEGDNVVINDLDYPTMIYPFARLESRYGVEVRVVRSRDFDLSTRDFAEAIDRRTRLVPVSHVSYLTELRHDLHALAKIAHRNGAAILTDVSHSLGVVPLDLADIDFTVSCTYKWLLGIHGLGIFHWNRRLQPHFDSLFIGEASVEEHPPISDPTRITSRKDAGRVTVGNQSWVSLYALVNGLRYLEALGSEQVFDHVLGLAALTRARLQELGLEVITPAETGRHAGNVAFRCEGWHGLSDQLTAARILVWGGQGRIRVSPFVYNDEEDVETLVEFLKANGPRS